MEPLTARLAVGMMLLVIIPLAGGLYLLAHFQYEQTIAARRSGAELDTQILETALRHQMLRRDTRLMTEILQEVERQPEVQRAMVIDHKGVVRLSSRDWEIGIRMTRDSPTCLVCHAQSPSERKRWVLISEEGVDILRSVLPVENRAECHTCHDPAVKLNGMLVLDVSLAPIQAQFRTRVAWMGVVTALLSLVVLGGTSLHIRRLVLARLGRLGRTARAIAGGSLGERADTGGNDVISTLANDFNAMADATSQLIAKVKEREQQISGVLNSLDDGLIVLDPDFKVVAANRSISRRLCTYPEALRGQSCRDAIGHELPCHEDEVCPTARCLSTGRLQRAIYQLPDSADGDGRVHEVYASPVFGDDGSVAQVVEVWRDITERVRDEEHLAEIERLSSLGVLASGLSHEVNTPLATTLACSEIIIDQLSENATDGVDPDTLQSIRESAIVIRDQVLHCRSITDQFLRFARGIPPAIEPIDLRQVVRGILTLAAPTAREAGIDLKLQGDDPVPLVTANTEVVQHVVLNVLVNAIESFDRPGGTIVGRFIVDSDVRLQIRDNGCGIAPDVQRRLFEPFRTQKPRGTGLGLFLSRTFMRRFGGDVRLVDSDVGRGSCVEIIFAQSDDQV
jgi:PAS domain S-box-containing protein